MKTINEIISDYRDYKANGGTTSDFLYLNRINVRQLVDMMLYIDTGEAMTNKRKSVPRYKTKCTSTETKRKQSAKKGKANELL